MDMAYLVTQCHACPIRVWRLHWYADFVGVIFPVLLVLLADHSKSCKRSAAEGLLALTTSLPGVIFSDGDVAIRGPFRDTFGDEVSIEYDYFHLLNEVFKKHSGMQL